MPKQFKKVTSNETRCKDLHREMNGMVAPTRLEPTGRFPAYIIPDLDPLQKQVNRINNTVDREARCARRRAWRK